LRLLPTAEQILPVSKGDVLSFTYQVAECPIMFENRIRNVVIINFFIKILNYFNIKMVKFILYLVL